ncbi:ATP-binding protein [Marinomonas communis]|uniref:ATP-binding protein n=1 Tax=Marinomonas communis TaxID=28254 RepID=UPI001D182FED|nr:ATP-binding protein [Marinomonas communis]MCC4274088.1 response regulator [Marinomonas communis]
MRRKPLTQTFRVRLALFFSLLLIPNVYAFELTSGDKQWIERHNAPIIFTGDPNWLPFEAFTDKGEYIGIVASFLKRFSNDTGIEFEFRPTSSWSESLSLARAKQVDVLSDVLGSLTLHDNYTFTDSYISNNLIVISNKIGGQIQDLPDIHPSPVGIIKGYGYTWELYQRYPDANFIEVEDIHAGISALESGQFDFLITTYALGQFQLTAMGKTNLEIRGQLPIQTHLAFAVRKDWPQLVDMFNRWIESLTPEQRYQIAESWYLDNTNYLVKHQLNWAYISWSSLIILLLLSLVGYAWRSRSIVNHQRQRFKAALIAINAVEWRMSKHSAEFEISRAFRYIVPPQVQTPKTLSEFIDTIHQQDQEQVYEAFRQARLSSHQALDIEFRLNTETPCWLALKGSTSDSFNKKSMLLGTIENITPRKVVESEKNQSDAMVTLLFEVLPDLVVLDLFEQETPIANQAYRSFFGERTIFDSLTDEQKEIWLKQEHSLLKNLNLCHTSTWVAPTEEHKAYFSIIRTPFVNTDGDVVGILSVARDITDTFLLQQELQDAKHRADQANASKSVFLANMSHEIRTPLNAILGYAQLLQQDNLGAEPSRQIERIYSAGQRLLGLINDILDLSKIEAGRLQLHEEKFPLTQELQDLVNLQAQKAQDKGLQFKVEIQLNRQDHAVLDKVKFGQIITNALDNAVKFTQQGTIQFTASYRNKHLKIRISDTGPGISQEELDHLFTPFSQGQSGKKNGGTGLGLVLSRRLADAMGGTFALHSTLGQGTDIQIDLPVTITAEDTYGKNHTHQKLILDTPKTALIIEDDEPSRDMLNQTLIKLGFKTILAEDGAQALEFINSDVDIVFSDIRMPKMDGMTLIQRIRQQTELSSLPVIAVTASSLEHEKEAYLKSGFSDFIAKPIHWQPLCDCLTQFVHLIPNIAKTKESPIPSPSNTPAKGAIDEQLQRDLMTQFRQACQLGDADDALECLNKLQESDYSSDKLDILKRYIERYDFDNALANAL